MAKKETEQTEISAPYELPEGWKWVQQNEVCRLTDGEKKTDVSYPYLEVKYLRGTKEKQIVSEGKFIKAGTKVILVDGENSGEVFTVFEDGYMGSTFKALNIQNVNDDYLQYFIATKKDFYRNNKRGSAIPHLDKKLFFSMPFPLPPTLDEQQRIVSRIESMFTKLDEARDKAQSVVDGFELRRAAILHKAFTGELTAKWRKENGVKDESWEEKTIGECGKLLSGQDFKPENYNDIENGIPYITGASNFELSHVILNRWTPTPSVIAKKGDVLLVCKGSGYGKTIIADFEEAHIARQIMSIRVGDSMSNKFIFYYLQNKYEYLRNGGQGLIPGIARNVVLTMPVKVPTLPEQQEIVRILDSVLEKEADAKETAEYVLSQIDLLKKSILARAFRGKL